MKRDFPGGIVEGSACANAGDTGSILWNIQACVPQLLSAHAAATEACMPRACAPQQGKSPQREAHTPQ